MYGREFSYPMFGNMGMYPNMARGMGFMPNLGRGMGAGLGNFSRITGAIKGMNWGGLLSNASRALGVVNQAVPLVKQVGPMFGNMRSMFKLASVFKDETDNNTKNNKPEPASKPSNNSQNDNPPNFFL